jgi:hypothetical protein
MNFDGLGRDRLAADGPQNGLYHDISAKKKQDYCGSKGSEWVPDGNWSGACKRHDDCYGALGTSKLACDAALARDITIECSGKAFIPAACASVGILYYFGVRVFGKEPFRSAQSNAWRRK